MSTLEDMPEQSPASEFQQRNTYGTQFVELPNFDLCVPQEVLIVAGGLHELASSRVLQRAQQVLFLPCFAATDHIFHGEFIDSTDPQQGFASIRIGVIKATNFHATIIENFNNRRNHIVFEGLTSENRGAYLNILLTPGAKNENADVVDWLDRKLFTPLRDELMGYQRPAADY